MSTNEELMKQACEIDHSRSEAGQCRCELTILRQRYKGMDAELRMSQLRNECSLDKSKISAMEAELREIESDPDKDRPSKVDQKRRLPRLKLKLARLRSKYESQHMLLEFLEMLGDMNDALGRAASTGDEPTVRRLLSRGVDVNVPDGSGFTAFMYAVGQGHTRIAELMISVGGANVNDPDSNTPPVFLATNKCHVDLLRLLISHGAKVDVRDALGQSPLVIACEKGFEGCARVLLEANANPNLSDKHGNTGLHHCALNGNASIAKALVKCGANDSLRNNDRMTATAIARFRRHFQVVEAIAKK